MSVIDRVLLVGGTHGNELIGVQVINVYQMWPARIQRSSFETIPLHGNPKAISAVRRYIDHDLNRSFDSSSQLRDTIYEAQRADFFRRQFGSNGTTPASFIIDLHSTTSNAGTMLIVDSLDELTMGLLGYLNAVHSDIKVYYSGESGRAKDSLRSLAPHRVCIEVGPVAHGTLDALFFQKTESVIQLTLDYLEMYNLNKFSSRESEVITLYQYCGVLDYPRDETGKILAMIHPQRISQDYSPLKPGEPMFITFSGENIPYSGESTVYPIFINEAAYYEKNIAACLTQEKSFQIQSSFS